MSPKPGTGLGGYQQQILPRHPIEAQTHPGSDEFQQVAVVAQAPGGHQIALPIDLEIVVGVPAQVDSQPRHPGQSIGTHQVAAPGQINQSPGHREIPVEPGVQHRSAIYLYIDHQLTATSVVTTWLAGQCG